MRFWTRVFFRLKNSCWRCRFISQTHRMQNICKQTSFDIKNYREEEPAQSHFVHCIAVLSSNLSLVHSKLYSSCPASLKPWNSRLINFLLQHSNKNCHDDLKQFTLESSTTAVECFERDSSIRWPLTETLSTFSSFPSKLVLHSNERFKPCVVMVWEIFCYHVEMRKLSKLFLPQHSRKALEYASEAKVVELCSYQIVAIAADSNFTFAQSSSADSLNLLKSQHLKPPHASLTTPVEGPKRDKRNQSCWSFSSKEPLTVINY